MIHTETLKRNHEFRTLYYRGKSQVHPLLVTYARKNRLGYNRIGITTTKKIGKATERNRARRIIREAYRMLEPDLPVGWDFVFVARTKTTTAKMPALLPVIKNQIETLTSRKKEKR